MIVIRMIADCENNFNISFSLFLCLVLILE